VGAARPQPGVAPAGDSHHPAGLGIRRGLVRLGGARPQTGLYRLLSAPRLGDAQGDDYVDYVGVDVYDTSWAPGTYPYPTKAKTAKRAAIQASVWKTLLSGERGLAFWAAWASARGKRMAVPEWGLSERVDGHGGGDDVTFVRGMLDFIADPRNDVAFAMYFDVDTDTGIGDHHRISTSDTRFPRAAAVFRQLMADRS
jgi:hypothetical protein